MIIHKRQKKLRGLCLGLAALALVTTGVQTASAADGGKGFYLLGSRAHLAGVMPGPGGYFSNDLYIYDGGGSNSFPLDDFVLSGGLDGTSVVDLMTALQVLPVQFLGGTIAIGLTLPVGWQEISARGKILGPNGGEFPFDTKDDDFEVGDPVMAAALGWHSGNFHWQLGGLLNVPIGSYDEFDLVNLGFNRWAFDLTGAATYLDMATGVELSGALGVTFNGENKDTGYNTGTELHIEFAGSKMFANGMSLGMVGYHYQQLSGDSGGTPAQQQLISATGGFKGRSTAIGPSFGMTLPIGDRALSMNLRWYHELETKYRTEGDAVIFTAAVPLQADPRFAASK